MSFPDTASLADSVADASRHRLIIIPGSIIVMMKKIICVILDGAAEPRRSAFAKASMPYLDHLASHSYCGMWSGPHIGKGYNTKSLSEPGILNLLGYGLSESPGRGYMEALGIGLKPAPGDICLRANFATVDSRMKVVDRRAGFDETGLD